MRILALDTNHPLLLEQLREKGCNIDEDYTSSYDEVCKKVEGYEGIIIRSRIPMDENLLSKAKNLKFIARVGAGLENIDGEIAKKYTIQLINSPEGNRDSVAEHVLGMLLVLMHRLFISSQEVKKGIWLREENRGDELLDKTVGIIGYGNMGKATAKRFSGFGCRVICHDILPNVGDEYAKQVSLDELKQQADIISLHLPITPDTHYYVDKDFINSMAKSFYLVNTARGKNVKTKDLVEALKSGKVKGAALDVLEYEKASFENIDEKNEDLEYLLTSDQVIITPHIGGWTHQSKIKLAQVIVDKIIEGYF